jgi:glycerol-1-phosphate dehydrogenase [NAD(P)+]
MQFEVCMRKGQNMLYDPAAGTAFWTAIKSITGYPRNEVDYPIREMIFDSGALFRVPALLHRIEADPNQPVLVVMDSTPMQRAGANLKTLVIQVLAQANWQPIQIILEPDATGQIHTDMPHIERVKAHLTPGVSVMSVGSGTITDIAKHACYEFQKDSGQHIPFLVFQTANSVSAYTSNMAPVFMNGVKRTLPSRYPDALVCDLETLRDAPYEMTVAGVGDLLAASVSFPDWYMASQLGLDETYTEFPHTLTGTLDDSLMDYAEAIRTRSIDGMAVLAKLISLAGLAMSLAHTTAPLSGFEHVISHMLDLQAEMAGRPLAQHGTQVALAAMIGCATYHHVLTTLVPDEVKLERCYPSSEMMRSKVVAAFEPLDPSGKVGQECLSDYQIKLDAWHTHRTEFQAVLANWGYVRAQLEQRAWPAKRVLEILRAVDSPLAFGDLIPPMTDEQVKIAFLNAPLMRKRFSVGDLLIWLDWDRETLWKHFWKGN